MQPENLGEQFPYFLSFSQFLSLSSKKLQFTQYYLLLDIFLLSLLLENIILN